MSMQDTIMAIVSFMVTLVIAGICELCFGPVLDAILNFGTTTTIEGITPDFTTMALGSFVWFGTGIRIIIIAMILWVVLRTIMGVLYTRSDERYYR